MGEGAMIYFDSSATSYYRPPEVAEAVAGAIRTMGNCGRGVHQAAMESARMIFETRQMIDQFFDGYGPEQVAFTANATESLNIAIKGLFGPGDRVVTTVLEHNSVLRPLYELEAGGAAVERVGCLGAEAGKLQLTEEEACRQLSLQRKGILDMEALHRAIRPGVKGVVVTHASNLTGNVQDIDTIGRWCREAGALFVVDASQSAGILPISMKRSNIDVLCFTGHKGLLGPQGTGGICVRKGLFIRPLLTGGSGIKTYSKTHPSAMPEALEAGTLNGHGIAGLRAALKWIQENGGCEEAFHRENELARAFYEMVREIPQIRLYGDFERPVRTPVVALNLGDADSGEVSDWLAWEHGIYTRSGGHCAPLMHQALGTRDQGAVRFSFSRFNTMEQVQQAAQVLKSW